ncbi:type III-A CRISPR-associated protein Csm2 [Abiotrophia defectiva]|jgi:CRISPR-associated protein, csm2 family
MTILTDKNYVDKAEQVVKKLNKTPDRYDNNRGKFDLTTSKIRNLLSLTSSLFDEVQSRPVEELEDKIAYLRVQFLYQSGREGAVKDLVEKAEILDCLKEITDKASLIRFCRYMEALVAYFKFEGGKD